MTRRAVILARGLGTRMRAADPDARLTPDQARAADAGLKPMIPVNGRPFLDYVLSSLADAGITEIALVVAPDHEQIRAYYEVQSPPSRMHVAFVVQAAALGTANAILAVERWADRKPFLAMNADNSVPVTGAAGSRGARRARTAGLRSRRPDHVEQHSGRAHPRVCDRRGHRRRIPAAHRGKAGASRRRACGRGMDQHELLAFR